jgi:hypothetical protein
MRSIFCIRTAAVHGRSDHWGAEGARGGGEDGGSGAPAWRLGSDALQLEGQVRRHGVSAAKRLKQLEDENAKLKKLLAKQMLDAAALRELL